MPKIDVNEKVFFELSGKRWTSKEELEEALICAKAELDGGFEGDNVSADERTLKIELNDTNRPDLWGTAGCARQLRLYNGGKTPVYPFFSTPTEMKSTGHKVKVEKTVCHVRPFLTGFVARGKKITDPILIDMIQTQEKLAGNFGRKRKTISMGIYRTSIIKWPIIYKGVDPDSVSFVPLQWDVPLTLTEILKQHPKGKEYAFIQQHEKIHPLLTDSTGAVLSYPPIINSADLGAVQVGDNEIFVELTGTDQRAVNLAGSIMACDLADSGFTIEPVEVEYEYDTPFGRKCVTPCYFQEKVFCSLNRVEKFLGEKLSAEECVAALAKMGVRSEKAIDIERGSNAKVDGIWAWPPEYRNDFLHAADVAEDVMIGRGLNSFKPERPRDFTVGRLSRVTLFSRRLKELMTGLGYQEMIYNYLGSRKDLVEKMRAGGNSIIHIFNPMTENYEYVRDSIIASLMTSESISGRSAYPHKIFEVGKIARLDDSENYRSTTRQYAGFLHSGTDANFNTAAGELQTLFYYLSREYEPEESKDPRFIPGRAASILYNGKPVGVFGEIHPEVLENWGVTVPCTAGEIDLDALL
jgi:phenylalanyl-tRNA synthetase beta chain